VQLRIARFLASTRVEGPGERACVWVQGCPIRCAGCAVPWTWPEDGGDAVSVEDLARRILDGPPVEGVTFAGGEPFAQAGPLAQVAALLRAEGLSVLTYSGYTIESLRRGARADWDALLDATDLLVDGPFLAGRTGGAAGLAGSSNQRLHFLTPRYAHLRDELQSDPQRIEVRLGADGEILVNGVVSPDALEAMLDGLACVEPPSRGGR
jgi:anaerobic ribonucleoside-triphosphate reductase activating protein